MLQKEELDRPQLLLLIEVLQQQFDTTAYSFPRNPFELNWLFSSPYQKLGTLHVQIYQVSVFALDKR